MLLDYFYYTALTVAALYEKASADEQPGWRELLTTHREQLREWADNYPPTFADKHALVSAEIARIEGRDLDAMELYEEAIREARKNGFVQNEGTGNELAARFYLDRGYEKIAHAYLREARYSFLRWGALGKVKQFDERYPGLAEQASVSPTTTIGTPVEQLDLGTVMKASHAVSSEIVLEKLIKTLMEIAVEHGGAERGFLILPRGEENRIEAKAKTGHGKVEVSVRQSPVTPSELPVSLLRYVIRTQESVILDDASVQNLFAEDEYVRQRRPRSVLCLPLVKQAKLMGVLYLENNLAPRVFTPKRLATLELLTSQAAISLDHARVYADIRTHSVKLSQANEVLKRSLNALAHERQLQSVVGQVLMVLTDQIGGHSSTLWLINTEERRGYLHSVCQDGRVIAAKDSDHPKTYEWPDEDPGWQALQMKRPFVYNDPDADWQIRSPALRALFSELETQTLVLIPLVFAEQLTGMLSVRMATKRQVAEEELEFAQALAQQATLALELTRLAEQTKQTAIVVERERAAQERAAHLAKANEALRGCLDALASVPELDDFLGQVMAVLTRHLGAVSSTLRVLNLKQNTLTLELLFQDGRVVSPSEAKFPESWRSLSLDQQRAATFLDQPMTVASMLDPQSPIPEALRRYLLGLGVKTLLIIPLTLGGQANGQLSFRFSEESDFAPEKLEIARSLAIQASLAIHLTQLANTARHTAVLEERNQLAGEIHDSLAQFFTGIAMQLDAAKEVLKRGENNGLSYLERASELAHFGLAESRRSAFSLQPSLIEESGLIETLRKLVERSNIPGRLRCNFQSSGVAEESLPPTARHELLRIAQEAISNALRHAKPTVISVNLRCKPPNLVLEVTDNGSGIADSQAASREGFGFSNMRTRAENIGAQLKLRTTSGGGTTIAVHLPMNF
jgi:signal transduction histidine kinase